MNDRTTTIVLIEDDEDDYIITRDLLNEVEQGRFELQWVSTYEEALAWLRAPGADVYLVDYRLGVHDGLELLREALSQGVRAPIILLTGQGNREVDVEAMQAGAADYLVKGHIDSFLLERAIRYAIERKQAEEKLREAEARYRALVEQLPAIIYTVALDQPPRTFYISPQIESLLGFTPAEWMADRELWIKQIHPDDRERVLTEVRSRDARGEPLDLEYRVLARDGRVLWFNNKTALIRGEAGRAAASHGVMLDITERKQAEEEVQRHAARAEALARTAARLNAVLDLDTVLNTVCEETAHALNTPAALAGLYDERQDHIRFAATFGLPPDVGRRFQPVPRSLYEEYTQTRSKLVTIPDVQAFSELPNAPLFAQHNIRTICSAAMLRAGQLIGVLNALTFETARVFNADELALLQGLADQAAQAIVNARLLEDAERRFRHVEALRNIDLAITSNLDLRLTLGVILEQVTAELHVDAASLLIFKEYSHSLEFAAGRGFRTSALQHTYLRLGEGHAGQAALKRQAIYIPDLTQPDSGFKRAKLLAGEDLVAYYAVPLIAKGQIKGVLEIFHRSPLDPNPEWLEFLATLGGQAAIAIDNATLFNDLQRSNAELIVAYDATIEGWSHALDLRDKETEGHTLRVTEMSLRLAQAMGMTSEELVQVRRGGLLHDIGKMGVPDSILLKPGPLTDDEWVIMRKHPGFAYEMLSPITYLRRALDIPYCHHEKWDGSGYPRGLKGEQIPLAARIFAVVDVWDALRSDRPYRPAWPEERVREHIRAGAGSHFDPQVVEMFLKVMSETSS
jgi:PAS domain S-box-containing protein/putative nucleotidyltransferase with HDIG domain